MNSRKLDNLKLSSDIIQFNLETLQSSLSLTNDHHSYNVNFKIKTTKPNLIEVRPARGTLKPNQTKIIAFKVPKKMFQQEMDQIQTNVKFLLQAVNVQQASMSKEQIEELWHNIKAKTADLSLGYGLEILQICFGDRKSSVMRSSPSFMKVQQENLAGSSQGSRFTFQASPRLKSVDSKLSFTDDELSRKYEQLRRKESNLLMQRNQLFEPAPLKGKKGGINLLIVMFILAFLVGNFLRAKFAFS